jgi:multimeric flavodoxin WrbA
MDVLFIKGSARDDSVTSKLAGIAAGAMPDANVTVMRPYEMNIRHCTGCGSCTGSGVCVMDDDMHLIYRAVENSDIVIVSTPVYFSGPSSIIKQVIDRFHCVWVAGRTGTKKRTAALIAAGGRGSPIFSNTVSIAKAFAATIGAEWAGELTVCGTDSMGDIPEDTVREAYSFGPRIVQRHLGRV